MVRVKANVISPRFKWGAINHSNIGVVTKISPDGVECQVDFMQQSGWTGLVCEMELAAAAHTGIRSVFWFFGFFIFSHFVFLYFCTFVLLVIRFFCVCRVNDVSIHHSQKRLISH